MLYSILSIDLLAFIGEYYYVFAVCAAITAIIISYKNYKKKSPTPSPVPAINSQISPVISPVANVSVNVGYKPNDNEKSIPIQTVNEIPLEYRVDALKSKVKILFIDDDKKFNVVTILKDSGWKHTSSVTDIKTVDQVNVKEADILFVDINGVGNILNCEHGGLDISLMIKQKYPQKKVVIYSANKNTNAFHDAWSICDFRLEKNALPYQFQHLVEKYAIELYG